MPYSQKQKDLLAQLQRDWDARQSAQNLGVPPFQTTATQQQVMRDLAAQQVVKGRQMGKSQTMRDAIKAVEDLIAASAAQGSSPPLTHDDFVKTFGSWAMPSTPVGQASDPVFFESTPDMPALYPRMELKGNEILLTLPFATPTSVVLSLTLLTPIKRIDDYRCTFAARDRDIVRALLVDHFGNVEEEAEVDPHAPIDLFVEYIGACRSREGSGRCGACSGSGMNTGRRSVTWNNYYCTCCNGTGRAPAGESYASAWVDGGWNARMAESVLKAFFPEQEKPFDGDWFKLLLSTDDMSKTYKQHARKWHPDLNKSKGAAEQFSKLSIAYKKLSDPELRKRYEAGLKFALATVKASAVFRVPKSCGRVVVRGEYDDRHVLNVSKILSWTDIYNERGDVMCATWRDATAPGSSEKPFTVTYEDTSEFVINI